MQKAFLFIVLLVVTLSQGQERGRPGIRAGMNLTRITHTELGTKTGFYAGAILEKPVSKLLSFQFELYYATQGGREKRAPNGSAVAQLNFLSFAFTNKFFLDENRQFHLLGGPCYDIILKSHKDWDLYNLFVRSDFALYGGLGYAFSSGLSLEARFKHGLLPYRHYDYDEYENTAKYNIAFQIGAAYTFKLKSK